MKFQLFLTQFFIQFRFKFGRTVCFQLFPAFYLPNNFSSYWRIPENFSVKLKDKQRVPHTTSDFRLLLLKKRDSNVCFVLRLLIFEEDKTFLPKSLSTSPDKIISLCKMVGGCEEKEIIEWQFKERIPSNFNLRRKHEHKSIFLIFFPSMALQAIKIIQKSQTSLIHER